MNVQVKKVFDTEVIEIDYQLYNRLVFPDGTVAWYTYERGDVIPSHKSDRFNVDYENYKLKLEKIYAKNI